jgi:hypothetical protein
MRYFAEFSVKAFPRLSLPNKFIRSLTAERPAATQHIAL